MAVSSMSPKSFTAGEALAAYRRVKLSSGEVVYADQIDSDGFVGVTAQAAASGASVAVDLKGDYRTFKCVSADTFAVGATLYAADDGTVSDTSSGNAIGTAIDASTTAGDVVEVLLDAGSSSAPGPTAVANEGSAHALPIVIRKVISSTGATHAVATAARNMQIVNAWMIARDANAANVTLLNAGTACTAATAKGTGDDVIVPFGSIIAEYDTVASGAAITATFSATGAADIVILAVPTST